MVQAWTVGLLLYLSNDREKCDPKLCIYKTPFGKSGHISFIMMKHLFFCTTYIHCPHTITTISLFNDIIVEKIKKNNQPSLILAYENRMFDYLNLQVQLVLHLHLFHPILFLPFDLHIHYTRTSFIYHTYIVNKAVT